MPPVARQWMLSDPRIETSFDGRWGHFRPPGANYDMFTGGVVFPIKWGRADIGFSAGYGRLSCTGRSGHFVAGAFIEGSLKQSTSTAGTFTLGLNGQLGYSRSEGDLLTWSASVGFPLSYAFGHGDALRVVPFLTPAFGARNIGLGLPGTGVRFLVGGGLGILNQPSGMGVTLGVQRVIINGGKTVFGLGLSLLPHGHSQ